jgi:putative colanic acid biosysnthesis UDP-glucose lipid carrier transferase
MHTGNLFRIGCVWFWMNFKTENTLHAERGNWLVDNRVWAPDGMEGRRGYLLLKRSFDLIVSIFVIAGILSWLLPLLALLIKLDSGGPVFFIQRRVGRNAVLFACYKLRTMVINDLADERPAAGNDGRITRVGGWLRRTHLDELPQFFNVLLGSMSIVGPRPYMPADCRLFAELVTDSDTRHRVKPGITGMAQAKGLHGTVRRDRRIIFQRYHWDAWYISHADFGLDMSILRRTVILLLSGRR